MDGIFGTAFCGSWFLLKRTALMTGRGVWPTLPALHGVIGVNSVQCDDVPIHWHRTFVSAGHYRLPKAANLGLHARTLACRPFCTSPHSCCSSNWQRQGRRAAAAVALSLVRHAAQDVLFRSSLLQCQACSTRPCVRHIAALCRCIQDHPRWCMFLCIISISRLLV